ncbi:se74 [Alphabaculovirus alterspexiguae]|uniref:Se74 n=1 Tax=Spodoptera exigua multiple nucleopolyhedrovirus TaxID=10454 RepID=A0A3G2JU11_9ABAC|nr:se74 [Spodoptera exigua multiple nucleopolyhedrovirus]AYN45034.1 se74 [Spodoptera exigua multiple nucleopolyhedrovirus]
MSIDVPYERLGAKTKVDYIPLKLALNDLPENKPENADGSGVNESNNNQPKVDIKLPSGNDNFQQPTYTKQQMYDALVLGMLTFFCILVLLYAIYYFVILRDRQKSIVKPSYMF